LIFTFSGEKMFVGEFFCHWAKKDSGGQLGSAVAESTKKNKLDVQHNAESPA
jgi:hypothetical protein